MHGQRAGIRTSPLLSHCPAGKAVVITWLIWFLLVLSSSWGAWFGGYSLYMLLPFWVEDSREWTALERLCTAVPAHVLPSSWHTFPPDTLHILLGAGRGAAPSPLPSLGTPVGCPCPSPRALGAAPAPRGPERCQAGVLSCSTVGTWPLAVHTLCTHALSGFS